MWVWRTTTRIGPDGRCLLVPAHSHLVRVSDVAADQQYLMQGLNVAVDPQHFSVAAARHATMAAAAVL